MHTSLGDGGSTLTTSHQQQRTSSMDDHFSPVVSPRNTYFCSDEPNVIAVELTSKVGLLAGIRRPLRKVPWVYTRLETEDRRLASYMDTQMRITHRLQVNQISLSVFVMHKSRVLSRRSAPTQHNVSCRRFPSKDVVRFAVNREAFLSGRSLEHLHADDQGLERPGFACVYWLLRAS